MGMRRGAQQITLIITVAKRKTIYLSFPKRDLRLLLLVSCCRETKDYKYSSTSSLELLASRDQLSSNQRVPHRYHKLSCCGVVLVATVATKICAANYQSFIEQIEKSCLEQHPTTTISWIATVTAVVTALTARTALLFTKGSTMETGVG